MIHEMSCAILKFRPVLESLKLDQEDVRLALKEQIMADLKEQMAADLKAELKTELQAHFQAHISEAHTQITTLQNQYTSLQAQYTDLLNSVSNNGQQSYDGPQQLDGDTSQVPSQFSGNGSQFPHPMQTYQTVISPGMAFYQYHPVSYFQY